MSDLLRIVMRLLFFSDEVLGYFRIFSYSYSAVQVLFVYEGSSSLSSDMQAIYFIIA